MLNLRWVLGASFNAEVPADAKGSARQDVQVTLGAVDPVAKTVAASIPAYDLATHSKLASIRVYLLDVAHGTPTDGPGYVASTIPYTEADVSAEQGGADVEIPFPEVPRGAKYLGQFVLGFDDSAAA